MVQLPLALLAGSLLAFVLMAIPIHAIRLANTDPDGGGDVAAILGFLPILTVLSIPVVRRLHDMGRGGGLGVAGLVFIVLSGFGIRLARLGESALAVPLLIVSLVIVLGSLGATLLLPGTPGPNRYGRPRRPFVSG